MKFNEIIREEANREETLQEKYYKEREKNRELMSELIHTLDELRYAKDELKYFKMKTKEELLKEQIELEVNERMERVEIALRETIKKVNDLILDKQ